MNQGSTGRRLIPDTQAAEVLGLRVQTLRNWRCAKIGPPYLVVGARTIRYDEAELLRFAEKKKVEPRG